MLNTEEAVFAMIDYQGRLVEIVDRKELVIQNTVKLIKGFQALDVPIIPTVQVPEKLGSMPSELEETLGDVPVLSKAVFSALREPAFLTALHQSRRKQVILGGIEAHVCVLQTGLDLLNAGYSVYALSDGMFSRTAENHDLALMRLHDAGAVITSVEIVLFELIRTSLHPQFRTISKLVK